MGSIPLFKEVLVVIKRQRLKLFHRRASYSGFFLILVSVLMIMDLSFTTAEHIDTRFKNRVAADIIVQTSSNRLIHSQIMML